MAKGPRCRRTPGLLAETGLFTFASMREVTLAENSMDENHQRPADPDGTDPLRFSANHVQHEGEGHRYGVHSRHRQTAKERGHPASRQSACHRSGCGNTHSRRQETKVNRCRIVCRSGRGFSYRDQPADCLRSQCRVMNRRQGAVMAENRPEKCAHPGCNCPAAKESQYCGTYCEGSAGVPSIECNCRHPECFAKTS